MPKVHFPPYMTLLEEQQQHLDVSATHLVCRIDVGLGLEQNLGCICLALY